MRMIQTVLAVLFFFSILLDINWLNYLLAVTLLITLWLPYFLQRIKNEDEK